ncbi:hypothetical protein ACFQ41_08615 [Lacticaseibacillus suilingensis]|jgi:hypothetical protein|uniref:Uncharacterized protein n=1 Tax=Lacticaseibacillus suilingensis TaxID=2799577 RepID=A0ABW4BI47_9LACO|nr:hypothetical protein [Lacticaseibacillus suilingensis]
MLMQVQSGLSQAQVQKKQFNTTQRAHTLRPTFPLRQLAVLTLGLALLADRLFNQAWLGLVPVAVAALLTLAARHVFTQWAKRLDADSPVLVIRDGLRRAMTRSSLVVGDVIEFNAGAVLPFDVETSAPVQVAGWLKVVLTLTNQTCAAGIAPAGSTLLADAQVVIVATGDQRLGVQLTHAVFSGQQAVSLWAFAKMGLHLLLSQCKAVGQWFVGLRFSQVKAVSGWILPDAQGFTPIVFDRSLVENQQAAKEAAFRYHQDPVTSPSLVAG